MSYNENGDMVTVEGQVFRQIGWRINGGENDGMFIRLDWPETLKAALEQPHGGYSPVYIEIERN